MEDSLPFTIAFIDSEIDANSRKILDIGAVKQQGGYFHSNSVSGFIQFIKGADFIGGHNIINHDLMYLGKPLADAGFGAERMIDTLFLSPLLFPARPYHALGKDYKSQFEESNSPLADSIIAQDLFWEELAAFNQLDGPLRQIFFLLLNSQKGFGPFFRFARLTGAKTDTEALIRDRFRGEICSHAGLAVLIGQYPVELAYCLSLINANSRYSITPPWVLKQFPGVERIMLLLRSRPCLSGCAYCNQALDVRLGLKKYFGFDAYRTYGGEPLQERAVKAAVDNKSILAVFPTGGGKSITFQVPALMGGEYAKGLTVVISPLQSLMKDQVDNLERAGITEAVTINGLLDPIERAKSFERVEDGSASILYISPESLRSKTIERLILNRKVIRFVIDEAHCFSSWGHDFRVDYLYIGDFIKSIQDKKGLGDGIPVSCFTATAKQKVMEDIRDYFREKLGVELELFTSKASRTNLQYKVFEKGDDEEKYQALRDIIEAKPCPAIVYVSRTRRAYMLAERLTGDGFKAMPYHGKMELTEKIANQNAFISGEVQVMVATSAFGMGVDKKDVGLVVHYDISDSLENYIQEAGRAGRDENMVADCYVLYNEDDLGKHFILLNQTKLSIKEIQQVWKAIKEITRFRSTVSNSALEIARKAGWDENVAEIETRVTTAIAALEDAGYLKRGQNMPKVFANSILSKTAQEAINKIMASEKFGEKEKEKAVQIVKKLFSGKSRRNPTDETAETRVDYISDHLGIVKEEVINLINLLKQENILADTKDLTAFIKKGESKNRSLHILESYCRVENFLLPLLQEQQKVVNLKELNEEAEKLGMGDVGSAMFRTIINFWAIKHWVKRVNLGYSKNLVELHCLHELGLLKRKQENRQELARFMVDYLFEKAGTGAQGADAGKEEVLVEFSVHELKERFENSIASFGRKVSIEDVEDALFYLSRIESIKIEGGFLVVYNRLTIERVEKDNKRRYRVEDYQKLNRFYENKVQQIHIVGEYAKRMIADYRDALQFVEDYFRLNYSSFLQKYFKGARQQEIGRNLTPAKFRQLFGDLSPTQLKIINDNQNKYLVVAAGPGSGKTRVLVHKLASLVLMEDVKYEQLLMVTFSRAAATEFKKRLITLIGNAANYIEIKTFHSYCFDLLGRVGNIDQSDAVLKRAMEKIKKREVETSRITKTVLVIDEAQDMDEDEYNLVSLLMAQNEEMRVIAVGDDDQNIYRFRGASSEYLERLVKSSLATKYELVENYRSKSNLVEFANRFADTIQRRLKEAPIIARQPDNGKIKLVRYTSGNLIAPLVNDILATGLSGTTCVLAKTNEEASQITGLLQKHGMQAKLIQTNDGFSLYNLAEVRFFLGQLNLMPDKFIIDDEEWGNAKRKLAEVFGKSTKLEICNNIVMDFEAANPRKKYKSDLEVSIRESKLEDFFSVNGDIVFVSTIHKAKGKEFDNVFLMLENFNPDTDDKRRQLYVAITRAKQQLAIHLNAGIFNGIHADGLEQVEDKQAYPQPDELTLQLSHRDLNLGYFSYVQHRVDKLISGDMLQVADEGCKKMNGELVLKFSRAFLDKMEKEKSKGFSPKSAKVNFVVFWYNEDHGREYKIVLPEVLLERRVVNQ